MGGPYRVHYEANANDVRVCQAGLVGPFDPLLGEEKHADLAWLLPEGRRSP
jgi:hypothetical protein